MTKFEDRLSKAIETIAGAAEKISESTKAIQESQKLLNDNFLLHQASSEKAHELLAEQTTQVKNEVNGIREDFKATVYPIFKWMAIAIIAIAGGIEIVKLLGI